MTHFQQHPRVYSGRSFREENDVGNLDSLSYVRSAVFTNRFEDRLTSMLNTPRSS